MKRHRTAILDLHRFKWKSVNVSTKKRVFFVIISRNFFGSRTSMHGCPDKPELDRKCLQMLNSNTVWNCTYLAWTVDISLTVTVLMEFRNSKLDVRWHVGYCQCHCAGLAVRKPFFYYTYSSSLFLTPSAHYSMSLPLSLKFQSYRAGRFLVRRM